MKKLLVVVFLISIFAAGVYATAYIGVGFEKEMGGMGRSFAVGRLTLGNILTTDIEGLVLISNPNPMYWFEIYTYVNLSIPISNFEVYAGFSPTWFFYNGSFSTYDFNSHGYLHAGVAMKLQPIRVYGEIYEVLNYSPISLGNIPIIGVGAQLGF